MFHPLHVRDIVFGATHDAYSSKFSECEYMNPEHSSNELHNALGWIISSSLVPLPFCAIAIYPRWKMENYMELLAHPNVSVAAFRKHTFYFLSPDHW